VIPAIAKYSRPFIPGIALANGREGDDLWVWAKERWDGGAWASPLNNPTLRGMSTDDKKPRPRFFPLKTFRGIRI
jgi:hypothetical protein